MTDKARRILEAALQLPEAERVEIAAILADSIGDGSSAEEVEAAWIEETKRRSAAIERGEMELVDSDELMATLRARVRRSREPRVSTG